jgi:hypothetical protein
MGENHSIQDSMDLDETRSLIEDAHDLGVSAIEISGEGEPLMDRQRLTDTSSGSTAIWG